MSDSVQRLIDRLDTAAFPMHGLLVQQHGRTVCEAYWGPFGPETPHRMYSVSKSVTALGIGILIGDGKLKLSDTVASYFPDLLPESSHPYVMQTTVRDLLRMATPHSHTSYTVQDPAWVDTFFRMQPSHPSGTLFAYDTAGTTVLSALMERITGGPMLAFFQKRLFGPLGFSRDVRWVETPEGVQWGGSGLICTLRDMAKLARLCLQKGKWNGEQLVPAWYIEEATTRQIDNTGTGYAGYGYQIWVMKNGFQFYGMGSQYAFCYPRKDLIIACTGDTQLNGARAATLLQQWVDVEFAQEAGELVPRDAPVQQLPLHSVMGELHSPISERINGARFRLAPNAMSIEELRLTLDQENGCFRYQKKGKEHTIHFGLGHLAEGEFPECYFGRRIGTLQDTGYRYLASAAWVEPKSLLLRVHIVDDYLGGLCIRIAFKGDMVSLQMEKSAEWFLEDYQGFAGGERIAD